MTSRWHNKLARISRMNGDELFTRLAQELNKRTDLLRHQLGMPSHAIRLHALSTEGQFFFDRGHAAPRAQLLQQHLPTEAAAVVDEAEAEAENAADVLQEAEGLQAAEESEILSGADLDAEADAESEGITAEELAIEDVPDTDETESDNE